MKKVLIVCAAVALFAVNGWADTVTFKSGKRIEGNVKAITNDTVTVDIYGVTEMTYDLADIQEINGQIIDLKPAAPSAVPVETAVPEAETAPTGIAPVAEVMATAPPSEIQEEMILPPSSGETIKIKLSDKENKAALAVIMAFLGIILTIFAIFYISSAICLQVIAKKTDTGNGWRAWIPIANLFLACNIGKVRYIWLLLLLTGFVPLAGAFLAPICDLFLFGFIWYRIALVRGKEGWIGAITVIPVVGLFTMGYLAFSKKEEGAAPVPNIGGGQPANPLGTAPTYKPPLE
ncbi:MAG: hypothetical protein PHR22_03870 [Candidatus Omnitrophica bacterium]|nr:hypothetical protein [Candidatus Omnitrophota bacterium]